MVFTEQAQVCHKQSIACFLHSFLFILQIYRSCFTTIVNCGPHKNVLVKVGRTLKKVEKH